jgi:hypothetical protein
MTFSGAVLGNAHINATTSLGFGPGATGNEWRVVRESTFIRQYFTNSATHTFVYDESTGRFSFNVDQGSFIFHNDGNTAGKVVAGQWLANSDARIKERIEDYTAGLDEVLALRPRVFSFRTETGYDTTRRHVSLIAQEVAPVMPEMVMVDEVGRAGAMEVPGLMSFDPTNIQYALINAVKTIHLRLTALEGAPA